MKKRTKVSVLLGAVALIATIVIYAIISPELSPSTIIGFGFLLYSEIVFFGGFALAEHLAEKSSEVLTRAGVGAAIEGYSIVVFISSIIYLNFFSLFVGLFLVLQVILLVAAISITTLIAVFSKSSISNDKKVIQADSMVRGFVDELMLIRKITDKKADIDKLIEKIKYSDTSVMVDADVELNDAISNLESIVKAEELDNAEFEKAIKDIEFLAKKRNLQAKNSKQGGI